MLIYFCIVPYAMQFNNYKNDGANKRKVKRKDRTYNHN